MAAASHPPVDIAAQGKKLSSNVSVDSRPARRVDNLDGGFDSDPTETREWIESLESVIRTCGQERAAFILQKLDEYARAEQLRVQSARYSAYQNSIPLAEQAEYPGNIELEERITSIVRWNALAMVVRANKAHGELGGHIASFASAAEIFETGFNHFFRAAKDSHGDLVYFQPHSAPGVYARAYLENRLSEEQLANFRREVSGVGLSSYPHPWLMPDFWQFPTGSMGLGPINSIYQARFMRYLEHRGQLEPGNRRVWGIFGDGEMDEPESLAALSLAARENLDNLTFVINCNLQRLDGPVRGNGQIIQELESLFSGCGWNVLKVLWGSEWDELFRKDKRGALARLFSETTDGQFQNLGAKDGAYNLEHFFALDEGLRRLTAHMTADEIGELRRGGHDVRKLYAAMRSAVAHIGSPTVILAKTKKGFGMGRAGESRMNAHQQKKLDIKSLLEYRDRFELPISDEQVARLSFYRPDATSEELQYLLDRRRELGGFLPSRARGARRLASPELARYGRFALNPNGKPMSTTMGIVRLLSQLLKDSELGPAIVPIVADEARTFGIDGLFRQIGIYSPRGQQYEAEDSGSLLCYRESSDGQLLQEGISEAGALSSWIAAATSYTVHGQPKLPFYIFYSMFGFQRVGDLIWAAADQRARGFLIGATAGRTTLGGEGLQHQDGSSPLVAATVPNCRSYDPAFACEAAVIIDYGIRQMMQQGEDVFYYLTAMNESYPQPNLVPGSEDDIVRGMYKFRDVSAADHGRRVRLLGSGAILQEVVSAAELLADDWDVTCEIWSVTSYSMLADEAKAVERWNRLHPAEASRQSHVEVCLRGDTPVVAASDYVRAHASMIAPYIRAPFTVLGTDGFGRSDTRQALRAFFEVDRYHVAVSALHALSKQKKVDASLVAEAIEKYEIELQSPPPWSR